VSLAAGLAFYKLALIEPSQIYSAAGVVAGVCATLLGFLVAAVALVTALTDKTLISNMRKTGHYRVLVSDTFMTCTFLLITLSVSVFSLVVSGSILKATFSAVLFGLALSLLYVYEAGRRFSLIVQSL